MAKQPGLEEYSALWTAIHIAFGDFAERQFALTGEKRFIRAARWAYSTPLKKSTIWKADLGTRCICAARLGELYCEHGSDLEMPALELARAIHDAYWDVLGANERLYQRSPFRESRERLQARVNLAVARIIELCVYLAERSETESANWRQEAFMIAENGKSRMLREELALAERFPPPEIPPALCDAEKERLSRLHKIYAELAAHRRDMIDQSLLDEFDTERNELRLDLEQIWAEMEDWGDAARAYVSVRRDEAIQWGELQWDMFQRVAERLGERVALISISRLPEAVFLSVLRAGWEAPEVRIVFLPRERLLRCLHVYDVEILNRFSHPPTNEWQGLGEALFAPLEPLLADVDLVYFFPHGPFHQLPLHALTVNGKPFIERWAVAYAPSVSVLESTLSRPKHEGTVLVMGYAPPDDPRKRLTKLILKEASEVATYFHTLPVPPEDANAEMLRKHGESARLIHLSCHGKFDHQDPLNSGIKLADGRFNARDWLRLRLRADLVTLSACQTGISDIRPGDDLVGLMRAILFAGSSSLLMTLWSVDAPTTRDWMLEFYRNIWSEDGRQIADKATAFRNATLELRKNHADPYFWAPFVLVGNFQ
ncbi:MAG TPA: CHAT domain-containing protein [Desulfobacterales bacterium]|nr:CHAT domain-containing protein [Desulfobacterales bacterium]